MKSSPFSRTALVLLFASALALFALSVLLHAYDDSPAGSGGKARPGSYSISAIGHAGFYDLLRRLDYPVRRSIGNTLSLLGAGGLLIMAEPDQRHLDNGYGPNLLQASRLLLVLPKWRGTADLLRPAWISEAQPLHLNSVREALALVTSENSDVFRQDWPQPPTAWRYNDIGIMPSGSGMAQLIRSSELRPIVGTEDGMLVGELVYGGRVIWVLADPDVMSNHGLGQGENAAFMVALLDCLLAAHLGDTNVPIVFDETVHGFSKAEGSPVKLIFRFPFVVVTMLFCATAVMLALAGTRRFGAPRRPPPELDFGKTKLIENSARLLDYAGHQAVVLKRYVRMTVRLAAQALHAPPGLDEAALARWLDRIGEARKVSLSCAEILHTVSKLETGETAGTAGQAAEGRAGLASAGKRGDIYQLFACARDIHRWNGEILNGSSASRQHR